jgi:hypothetical protein
MSKSAAHRSSSCCPMTRSREDSLLFAMFHADGGQQACIRWSHS